MFMKNGVQVHPLDWIEYSSDGSGEPPTMVQTQPKNATLEQLALMGVMVVDDPPPPDPPPSPPVDFIEYKVFRSRWTDDEKYALFKAQAASWQINDWINLAVAQNGISLISADAAAAKAAMVAMHVLTQERADVIFAP